MIRTSNKSCPKNQTGFSSVGNSLLRRKRKMIRCPRRYPSDTKDKEWRFIKPLLPPAAANQQHSLRQIVDAIFYVNKTGCQWRALPHEYPPWSSVYYHFAKWSQDGTLEAINTALCKADRRKRGRKEMPTGALIDSQSVKTTKECNGQGLVGKSRG